MPLEINVVQGRGDTSVTMIEVISVTRIELISVNR